MTMDKLFDGSDAHLLPGNAELIANLRGENLDCNCCAYSRSECSCDTCWPESFTNKAADALESADKRIAELEAERDERPSAADYGELNERFNSVERRLSVAREALKAAEWNSLDLPEFVRGKIVEALAQIGGDDAGS